MPPIMDDAGVRLGEVVIPWAVDATVLGEAKTQGSIRAINHRSTGKAVAIKSNNADQREWRAYVRDIVAQAWAETAPTLEAVVVVVDYVLPRRKGAPKGWTPWHTRKPDGDKLERAVWDALSTVVYRDDSQVVAWGGAKREAEPDETPNARVRLAVLPDRRPA